jgi:metacaspase-1
MTLHKNKIPKRTANVKFRKALLIGCNYTGTKSQLNGCINDINNIHNFLVKHNHFKESEITMMSDHTGAHGEELPTRANIITAINKFVSDIPKTGRCVLFFHYSGHGSYTIDLNGDEPDRRDETIVPLDYHKSGLIIDDDLKTLLVNPLRENVDLFCLMDACHSGTGLDLRYECRVRKIGRTQKYSIKNNRGTEDSKANVILISGCKDKQTSADAYIHGKYQGAMTWGFLKVQRKNKYRAIRHGILIEQMQDLLRKNRYTQVPQLSSGKYIELSEFYCIN